MARGSLLGPPLALRRLVDAINDAGPPAAPADDAALATALIAVLRRHGEPEPIDLSPDLERLRAVLSRLYDVFAASDADGAAALLNELLAEHGAPPRLTNEAATPWHLHVDPEPFAWDSWFGASGAFALALLLASHGGPAWGVCAAPGCGRVYANDGPGRPRRACSARCATRVRVAAHRARQPSRKRSAGAARS